MNRQQRRQAKKETSQEVVDQEQFLFHLLPEKCDICSKPFDKKDKQHVTTWTIIERREFKLVRLFCPECVQKTKETLKNVGRN